MPKPTRETYDLAESLKALADPVRIAIASALQDRPMQVTDLDERLGITPASAGHGLERLNMSGLVIRE